MKRLTLPIAVLALMFLFAGCGQSGPLYVPGNPSTMAVPPSANSAESDAQEEQDDDSVSSETD